MPSEQPDDEVRGDRGGAESPAPGASPGSKPYEPALSQRLDTVAAGFEIHKPTRQRMASRCQPLLPEEQIGYIIYCQRHSPYTMALRPVQPRVIAVTEAHVWIIRVGATWVYAGSGVGAASFLGPPKGIIAKLPRDTRIGPVSGGLMWGRATINGERVWIPRKYYKDVEAADRGTSATPAPI
jgi:hypothetical protein